MHISHSLAQSGSIAIWQADQLELFAESLSTDISNQADLTKVAELYHQVGQVILPSVTGVIFDPVYTFSLSVAKPNSVLGLARLEKPSAAVDPLGLPTLISRWGVVAARNNLSVAKFELFYNPREQKALTKREIVHEIADYCQHEGIDFALQLTLFLLPGETFSAAQFQIDQLQAIRELRSSCDLLALQYPQDPLSAATVTAELDIPWVLVANTQPYEEFKTQLRTALENGAKGWWLGDLFWQGLAQINQAELTPWVQGTVRDRVLELRRIADEVVQASLET